MTGEMRTSSKSVLFAHTAWYTGSCLFNTCLMTEQHYNQLWILFKKQITLGNVKTCAYDIAEDFTQINFIQSCILLYDL
jgi:hypothetical protein